MNSTRRGVLVRSLLVVALAFVAILSGGVSLVRQTAAQQSAPCVQLSVPLPSSSASPAAGAATTAAAKAPTNSKLDIAFLPKQVNNPYFTAAAQGGQEAANELGGKFKQVGPSNASASAQVPYITTLTQQHVAAIAISADDPNAIAPALKRAIQQGIKVVGYDSDPAADARQVFVNQADYKELSVLQVQILAQQMDCKGQFAILSATTTATNQNTWIGYMKDELKKPVYKDMQLVTIAYGNDDPETSLDKTNQLMQAYPNLKGIISPTTVGIAAAAQAIQAAHKSGQIALTGLGTPNLMRAYVKNGTCKMFALWDVPHLGYLTYYTAAALIEGKITGKLGETYTAGSLGKYTIGPDNTVVLGPPTIFTKDNIDNYHF